LLRFSEYQDGIPATVIANVAKTNSQFSITVQRTTNLTYLLWGANELNPLAWVPLTNAVISTDGTSTITLAHTNATASQTFYRVVSTKP